MDSRNRFNLSMFTLRLVLGCIFLVYGAQKLFGMFGGVGLEGAVKIVEGYGFPEPLLFAWVWAGIELLSGIFLVFGMFSRWAAGALFLVTLVRVWKINLAYGAFVQSGFIEYDLLLLAACFSLMMAGGGSWSVWDA
ncbi:MAG: DoxX family membrane protein [Candidatus Omnitrophica bacterium]|nr:DoxX family membrane protein [Candidatus Omnitrophota bacterium]